jgi:type VI secretion system secreted protein Hcp
MRQHRVMKVLRLFLPILAVVASCTFATARAETQYFLKLDGIQGDSTNDLHLGEIDVLSVALGVLQPQMQRYAGGGASAAKTEITPITVSKVVDRSSPMLFLACATGKKIPTAVLAATRVGEPPQDYYTITLSDVLISSFSQSAEEGGVIESVGISFTKITLKYTPQNPNGTPGTPIIVSFDLKANKPLSPE